jgi:hypothetical protein
MTQSGYPTVGVPFRWELHPRLGQFAYDDPSAFRCRLFLVAGLHAQTILRLARGYKAHLMGDIDADVPKGPIR